jgi:ABC-type phosphate transport system substrate-binding protein
VSGNAIKFLDLTGPGCNASTTPSTSGTSGTNGTTDSWGGCVTSHGVELGVTDLEPSVFLASAGNYPTAYSTAAFGSASPSSLVTLASSAIPLFQQVFGIFVNTAGLSNVPSPLNLSKETVAAILAGNYRDWSKVPTASGGQVSSTSATIAIKNREAGSGTRTGASLYFLGQECTTAPLALRDPNSINDLYSTGDVLKAANSTPGAITYASIDNFGAKSSTLTLAQLSGVTPGNLAAASGQYDYWFEATAIPGNTTGTSGGINSPGGAAIVKFLTAAPSYELQKLATAPHAADINVIPGQGGNTATVPLTSSTAGTTPIYINPFTRSGNSCNIPAEEN